MYNINEALPAAEREIERVVVWGVGAKCGGCRRRTKNQKKKKMYLGLRKRQEVVMH